MSGDINFIEGNFEMITVKRIITIFRPKNDGNYYYLGFRARHERATVYMDKAKVESFGTIRIALGKTKRHTLEITQSAQGLFRFTQVCGCGVELYEVGKPKSRLSRYCSTLFNEVCPDIHEYLVTHDSFRCNITIKEKRKRNDKNAKTSKRSEGQAVCTT